MYKYHPHNAAYATGATCIIENINIYNIVHPSLVAGPNQLHIASLLSGVHLMSICFIGNVDVALHGDQNDIRKMNMFNTMGEIVSIGGKNHNS